MFDIGFYRKIFKLKKSLAEGNIPESEEIEATIMSARSKEPFVFNIETTNACNMRCQMCPRTTMMTRPIQNLDIDAFRSVINQLRPFTQKEWSEWEDFAEEAYGVKRDGMSENHFFLYVIPKVIVLHGFGDPLLDKLMPERVQIMTDRGMPSYFSCNPANIDIEQLTRIFKSGLGYIKFSVESTDDNLHKEVRGSASNFTESYRKILEVLEMKATHGYDTTIVITMINLKKDWHQEEFKKITEAFKGLDVYIFLKSQDQKWYSGLDHETQAIHWSEFCQFPWSSMTIKSNGEAAMCVEDFNNEIILGDISKESLQDIWNGEKYDIFRRDHFVCSKKIKCTEQCDMKLIGAY